MNNGNSATASIHDWLEALEQSAGQVIEPSDLLAFILETGDPGVTEMIAAGLPSGISPGYLLAQPGNSPAKITRAFNGRGSFSPASKQAVSDFAQLSRSKHPDLHFACLCICVLAHFSAEERARWSPLDVDQVLKPYLSQGKSANSNSTNGNGRSLLAMEDLADHFAYAGLPDRSIFAGEKAYDAFFDALLRGLHRSAPRHVLLLRDRGVGDFTVLLELARRSRSGDVPFLKGRRILRVDVRRLPLEKIRQAIDQLFSRPAADSNTILCIEGFTHLLRDSGPFENRSFLLAALTDTPSRVVVILSPQEFEEHLAADAEPHDLFSIVRLHEPEPPVAIAMVESYAIGLSREYNVHIGSSAIHRSVQLAGSYILSERLPLKAVRVLRSICDDIAYNRSQQARNRAEITDNDVVAKVAEFSGIPFHTLAGVGDATNYIDGLGEAITGQEHAVREVATELGLIKAGLIDPGKPASVMLFVGQTGTGKTEMAKVLARLYSSSKKLKTFTLGNFSEPHSVSGLIGVPAGYVGHDQGGRLVNELNADPYSVFLLDEADKAHPDVMQPFLNLFDEGWLYDQRGVKAFADRAIFILTTNVGQRQIAEMCKQGKDITEITNTMRESLSRIRHTKSNRPVFTPEFLARIKRIIVFRSLDEQAMHGICRRIYESMQREWQTRRQKILQISDAILANIAKRAHAADVKSQGKEGGRIVRKLLADLVEAPIQNAIGLNPEQYRAATTVQVDQADDGQPDSPTASQAAQASHAVRVRFVV
jgi:ATP-dependent Clp protease ATP-binding subunit ClpA